MNDIFDELILQLELYKKIFKNTNYSKSDKDFFINLHEFAGELSKYQFKGHHGMGLHVRPHVGSGGTNGASGGGTFLSPPKLMEIPAMVPDREPVNRNPIAIDYARKIRKSAEEIEPQITSLLAQVSSENGAELNHLETRLKSTDSIARKLYSNAMRHLELSEDAFVSDATLSRQLSREQSVLDDAIRYKLVQSSDKYTETARKVVSSLQSDGWFLDIKNYWGNDTYVGLNIIASKKDVRMEVQIHSKDFLPIQAKNHKLYEMYREEPSTAKRIELWKQMIANTQETVRPDNEDGLMAIGSPLRQKLKPGTIDDAEIPAQFAKFMKKGSIFDGKR